MSASFHVIPFQKKAICFMFDSPAHSLLACPFCGDAKIEIVDHGDASGPCFRIDHWCGGSLEGTFIAIEKDSAAAVAEEWNRRSDALSAGNDAISKLVRDVETALNQPLMVEWFTSTVNGVPVVNRGETEFMRRKEVDRLTDLLRARVRAALPGLPPAAALHFQAKD